MSAIRRREVMVRGYRDVAHQLQGRSEALRTILTSIDLRALKSADPELAGKLRKVIKELSTDPVTDLDRRYADQGEDWQLDEKPVFDYDDDEWVPTAVASELSEWDGRRLAENQINKQRSVGKLEAFWTNSGFGWFYRVGDVRGLRAKLPTRGYHGSRQHKKSDKNPLGWEDKPPPLKSRKKRGASDAQQGER